MSAPARVVAWSVSQPQRALLYWGVVILVCGWSAFGVRVDTSADSVLDREDSAYAFHKLSQKLFGGEELIAVALSSEDAWDPAALRAVVELTGALEATPGVRRVDSLESVPLIRTTPEGDLDLGSALEGSAPETPLQRAALAEAVRSDRIALHHLASEDGRVLAINLLLEDTPAVEFAAIVDEVERVVRGAGARISGVPVFRKAVNTQTRDELVVFVPLTLVIIAVLLASIFQSAWALVVTLGSAAAGVLVMVGAMGAAGASITLITLMLPSIVLALGCVYTMHLLTAAHTAPAGRPLHEVLAEPALPIALSGITTAIGFLSIGSIRIEAVREVGLFGGLGVLSVLAATLTLAPALLRLAPAQRRDPLLAGWLGGSLRAALTRTAARHGSWVVAVWSLGLAAFVPGLLLLDVQTDATTWFARGHVVRDDYDWIRRELSGISPVNIVIASETGASVTSPDAVRAIDRLRSHLEALPQVGKAIAFTDLLRQLHGSLLGDPSQPLPQSQPLVEQYLLLLESVDQLADVVTADRAAANVMLRVDDNSSGALVAVAREAERWWDEYGAEGFSARGTGTMFEFARAEDEIASGQLRGLALAIAAIGLVLLAVLRSPRLAGIALVPNIVPIVATFGFMGLAGVALDAGTVVVGSLALGIAVDDTLHVLSGFNAHRTRGCSAVGAIDAALRQTLPAITYTSVVIALGFGIFALSEFTFTRNLGLIIAGVMGLCIAADVTLLPALLRWRDSGAPPVVTLKSVASRCRIGGSRTDRLARSAILSRKTPRCPS